MTPEYAADIRAAVDVLRRGGVILYPTDTVWGLGCDATSPDAVRRIFDIKRRADAKALITLVGSFSQLERTVDGIPEVAYQLIEYSERPVTIVFDRPHRSRTPCSRRHNRCARDFRGIQPRPVRYFQKTACVDIGERER